MNNDYADDPSLIQVPVGNETIANDKVIQVADPLTLDMDDDDFIKVSRKLIQDSKTKLKKDRYYERVKQNKKYLFGQQLDDQKLKPYKSRSQDNIIWEAESYLKPIALSRLPDIIVKPGQDNDDSQKTADSVSKVVDNDIKSRKRKKVLGLAFRHLPVYLTGIIKYFWNPEIGQDGDYDFKVVHPDNVVLDAYASSNDPQQMRFFAEAVEWSVKEWVMRFPKKEQDFYTELKSHGVFNDTTNETTESGMNTLVKGWEVWFDYYEKRDGNNYTNISAVGWFYENCCLDKIKNPNWDWEGTERKFTYVADTKGNKKKVSIDEMKARLQALGINIPDVQTETVFHNHFENPQKPYIVLGYEQWGDGPMDKTSRIEQTIPLQMQGDKRIKQIDEMLDRSRGKNVFSTDGGLKKEDIEELDMSDPETDVLVNGPVGNVYAHIQGEQPSPQTIQNLNDSRAAVFDKIGVHSSSRGAIETDVATTSQISREADFTRADDLVDDTINFAAEEMANAILQMIKLRYTKDHFVRILGPDGQTTFTKINRDMVDDGMEVTITASGTDKLKAEQRAMDMGKIKLIDPFQFYTDMHMTDPRGRTEKLMLFMTNPPAYQAKYGTLKLSTTEQLAAALMGGQQGGQQQPPMMGGMPQPEQSPVGPMSGNPSPDNTAAVNAEPPTGPVQQQ